MFGRLLKGLHLLEKENFPAETTHVRVPVTLNILGDTYHAESSRLSDEILYLRLYEDDLNFFPEKNSNLLLFISLNLYSKGSLDLEGKVFEIERLKGGRLGVWIRYQAESERSLQTIQEFLKSSYSPRYNVRFSVDILLPSRVIHGEAINLSEKGIFVEADPAVLTTGQECRLVLNGHNGRIKLSGRVTWINKGQMYDKPNGYGFQFIRDTRSKRELSKYIQILQKRSEQLR